MYEAESGRQCLEMLKKKAFDLVFLDHMMPEMDGIETLHEIKENELCENVPIIMLTANALVGDREKYISEGFDDFLAKPINVNFLDRMLRIHLPKDKIHAATSKTQLPKVSGETTGFENNIEMNQRRIQMPRNTISLT